MMESDVQPFRVYDLSGGMASYASDDVLPSMTAILSVNLHYDVIGDATQRNGTALLGAQVSAGNNCDGIAQFISSDQTKNMLVAAFNGTSYAFNGTSWASISGGLSAGTSVRYQSFLNLLFRVGGGAVTQTWDGVVSDGFSSTNAVGAPTGKYAMPYKQRMYIAGDATYPNRLWFSTIATFSQTITWDTSSTSTQYIDFTAGKANDVITGLGKISNYLIIFLNNAIYRWNGTSTDAEIIVDIGCASQDSIVQCKGSLYFFNANGIFVTDGQYPLEISRPVYDWIQAIPASQYSKVWAVADQDHIYMYIGSVTPTGTKRNKLNRTFNNVFLVYTVSSKNWQVYSMGNNISKGTIYTDSTGAVTQVAGDTLGNVLTLFSGNTDYAAAGVLPIVWEYESREEYFGSRATTETINSMAWFVTNGTGAQLLLNADDRGFQVLGEVTGRTTLFPSVATKGRYFVFRIQHSNRGQPSVFSGFEAYNVQTFGHVRS